MKQFLIFDIRLSIVGSVTAFICRTGMVGDLPATAGREARLKTCKPRFSIFPSLQENPLLKGKNA